MVPADLHLGRLVLGLEQFSLQRGDMILKVTDPALPVEGFGNGVHQPLLVCLELVVIQSEPGHLIFWSLPVGLDVALQELLVVEHGARGPAGVLALHD